MEELNETIDLINNYQKQLKTVNFTSNAHMTNKTIDFNDQFNKESGDDRHVEEANRIAIDSDAQSDRSMSSESESEEIPSDSDNEHFEDYDEDGLFKIVSRKKRVFLAFFIFGFNQKVKQFA